MNYFRIFIFCTFLLFLYDISFAQKSSSGDIESPLFPRIMGMNIGAKNYDDINYQKDLAKLDVVILGFYKGWTGKHQESMRDIVLSLKKMNPKLLVGQYTILNEVSVDKNLSNSNPYKTNAITSYDVANKVDLQNWWLLNANKQKVQWTSLYSAWDVNITNWSKPDADGLRFPEWYAKRSYLAFKDVPFDIWYNDNVSYRPYDKIADWKNNGTNQSNNDYDIQVAYRNGQANEWVAERKLAPSAIIMGNANNDLSYPEYKHRLNAAFFEAAIGADWSVETKNGWNAVMERYHNLENNIYQPDKKRPKIVGFNVWGNSKDYKTMRYGLTSCLMDDGYFSFSGITNPNGVGAYSSVPWFDEYDIKLGRAITVPQTKPWSGAVYRRDFENGIALVNSSKDSAATITIEKGFRHFLGTQDSYINSGVPVTQITLQPRDGVILVRDK